MSAKSNFRRRPNVICNMHDHNR